MLSLRARTLACLDRVAQSVHVHKHAREVVKDSRITHERPFFDTSTRLGGFQVGFTLSELHAIRAASGVELIQVVDTAGNSNLESVVWRKAINKASRVELQGPALNTCYNGTALPIDVRLIGIGLTGDAVDRKSHEAVSYTAEAKIHASDLIFLAGSKLGVMAAGLAGAGLAGTAAHIIVTGCAYAVPVVGTLIAASSIRWAVKVLKRPSMTPTFKAMSVGHAASDCVRIVFPLVGTLGNAALVGAQVAMQMRSRVQPRDEVGNDGGNNQQPC